MDDDHSSAAYHVEIDAFTNWTLSSSSSWSSSANPFQSAVIDNGPINEGGDAPAPELNMPYTIFEILVALIAIIGNAMVIYVFRHERKLRRRTNYYIVSLAIADLFVGLFGIPFAILAAIGLPTNLHACLFTISLLVVLCTISIFCLVAVSVDRYWAILHPMAYSRNVRTRTAIVIIAACWFAGIVIGLLPLLGWHAPQNGPTVCLFVKVMSYDYLVFLYFGTIVTPAILLIAFYAHIYRVIVRQLRQIVTMNPTGSNATNPVNTTTSGLSSTPNSISPNIVTGLVQQISRRRSSSSRKSVTPTNNNSGGTQSNGQNTPEVSPRTQSPFNFGSSSGQSGTMLRVLGAAQKREVKATQNLSIIVLFFMVCWMPLYTVNCVKAFCQDCEIDSALMLALIALSHVNSAVNPLLYAYHLRDFRAALKNLILRMVGREVSRTSEQAAAVNRRISAASRMQSMREKRVHHPRIYIDSPIWLRQQQAKGLSPLRMDNKSSDLGGMNRVCETVTMSSALRSVVRVASTPTNPVGADMMSQIAEVPSQAERESSKNLNDSSFGQLSGNRNLSKKSSQSSQLRSSNHQSFDYYQSGVEDDEEDQGIRFSTKRSGGTKVERREGGKGRRSSRCSSTSSFASSGADDVFVTSTDPDLRSDSISYNDNCAGEARRSDKHNVCKGIQHLHSTDLPTFHQSNHRHEHKLDESRFYDAFKRRRRGREGMGQDSSGERVQSPISPQRRTLDDDFMDCSSTGTISSEDLTEFRDRSASSVFIIENDRVQLSPSRNKKALERRSNSKKDILKHSPLKAVTHLIFSGVNAEENSATTGIGVSGKFSYVDMEQQQSPEMANLGDSVNVVAKKTSSVGNFLRSVSES